MKFHVALGIFIALASHEVRGQLIANFETRNLVGQSLDSGCIPDMIIQFNDLSTNGGVPLLYFSTQNGNPFNSHHWDFDYPPPPLGPNTSIVRSPVYGYFTAGTYNVTLTVTQDGITFDSITKQIEVFVPPSVRISASPPSGCDPHTVTFTNTSFSADTTICETLIDFGDGAVERKTGAAARDPFVHTYHLLPQQDCWTVTVIITDCRGCDSTRTYTNMVCIDRPPIADFTPSSSLLCGQPFTVTFDNTSYSPAGNPLAYQWDFGDTTPISTQSEPSHTYANAGIHIVTLKVIDTECLDTVSITDTIITRLIDANFVTGTPVVCIGPPATATFDAGSSVGQNLSYTWDFGDSTPGSGVNPQHSYAAAGTYTVTLNVSDDQGCSNTETQTNLITVRPRPDVNFTGNPTTDCKAPVDVTFSLNPSPSDVDYAWSFGDGETSTLPNPVHRYAQPNNYSVTLEVTDRTTGCTNTVVKNNYIIIQPKTVGFVMDVNRGCAPLTVNFINTSPPDFTMFDWDFGDDDNPPNTSSDEDSDHTFPDTGTFVITLTAAVFPGPPTGCSGTVTDTVRVGDPVLPTFTIEPDSACVNEEVFFNNTTDLTGISDSDVIFWTWSPFGSNNKDTLSQFFEEPTPPDGMDITLEACYRGCCADTTLPLVILRPKADFSIERSCAIPGLVIVTDLSEGANSWEWDFGDGTSPVVKMPPRPDPDTVHHVYAQSGPYVITLTVANDTTGCEVEKVLPTEVSVLNAYFDADTFACVGEEICFQNGSLNPSEWDFGDGTASGLVSPCHAYTQPGIYDVRLIIRDAYGCSDTLIRQDFITISGVTADFTSPDPTGCIPPTGNSNTISFDDLSSSAANSTITEWHWNFGDPPSQDYPPGIPPVLVTHTYPNPGLYTITLTVRNSRGCEDTETKTNYVDVRKPVACLDFPYGLYCEDQPIPFTHCSQGIGLVAEWDFGDSTPRVIASNPVHTYDTVGFYDITLYISDGNGCLDTAFVDSAFQITNPELCFEADDTLSKCPPHLACFDTCFDFSGIPVKSCLWDFGDGSFSSICEPCHIYVRAGLFRVTLYVEFENYCYDTLSRTSYIQIGGATGNITAEPDTGCIPLDVILNANDSGAISRFWITPWDPNSTGTLGEDTLSTTVFRPGSWRPAVVLTDAQFPEPCSYVLYADFDLWADTVYADFWTASDSVCRDDLVYFRDTSKSLLDTNIVKWLWDFDDGTTDTVQHPVHVFRSIGVHNVCLTAYSGIDCYAEICKPIFVRDKPNAGFTISDTTGCDTLSVSFFDTSTAGVHSGLAKWYWDYGDSTVNVDDTSTVRSPSSYIYRDTGAYQAYLVVTDSAGCDDTATVAINVYKTPDGIYNADTLQLCRFDTVQLLTDSLYPSYQWTPDTALSNDTIANPLAFPRDTTSYMVHITEPHGCDMDDTVTINVIPLPPLTVTPHPDTMICYGDTIQLNAVGGSNHQWQGLWLSNNSIPNPLAYPATTVTYTITNEGVGGCTNNDTVRVIVSKLTAKFVGERSCFGDVTDFVDLSTRTDLPIILWQWDFGNPNSISDTSRLRNPGYTYVRADSFLAQLTISDAIGCSDTATQIVIIDTPATAVAWLDATICFGDSVQLFSSGGAIVFWTPTTGLDNSTVFNPIATPTSTTTYTAHITNGVCPYDLADVEVIVIPPPDIRTIEDATLLRGDTIQLVTTVDRYDSIFWTPADSLSCTNCLSPFAGPDETITYRIDVRDEYGCTNSASVTIDVTVECKEDQIWVANAFMPGSTEFPENRTAKVHLIGLEKMNYFRIYDRWGKLMFETDDLNEGWDGTNVDGAKVGSDVYVFICEAVCWFRKTIIKKGNITLIR